MSKGALYEFNNPDQLKIPQPHRHIASTFNAIKSKDDGSAYTKLLYVIQKTKKKQKKNKKKKNKI